MNTYKIWECNLERLNKKLTTIQNKCKKYGCDFHFKEVGEEFETYTDDNHVEHTVRFVLVEAEGIAVINSWKFIGRIEHTSSGNIITGVADEEVPSLYYTVPCKCDHCKTDRVRNDTYIVKNTETGEFKQVGKSCLKDFTCGLSAELVAIYMNGMKELEEGYHCSGNNFPRYFDVKKVLAYTVEIVKHFGYVSSDDIFHSTKSKVLDYLDADKGIGHPDKIANIMDERERIGFNPTADSVVEKVNAIRDYFSTVETNDSTYLNNLKVLVKEDCTAYRNLGLLVSCVPSYDKAMDRIAKDTERKNALAKEAKVSVHVGNVGDKITVEVKECRVLYSFDTCYGYHLMITTHCYKFVDESGNVYTWKTSKDFDTDNVKSVKGTVKAHTEYKGVKQTELTRCKVEEKPHEETHEVSTCDAWDTLDMLYDDNELLDKAV